MEAEEALRSVRCQLATRGGVSPTGDYVSDTVAGKKNLWILIFYEGQDVIDVAVGTRPRPDRRAEGPP